MSDLEYLISTCEGGYECISSEGKNYSVCIHSGETFEPIICTYLIDRLVKLKTTDKIVLCCNKYRS